MNGINEFKLYWCEPIKITDKIILKTPTLSEIVDLGESNYLELVHTFTATTMDDNIIVSLTDAGIDFNHITNFQLFMLLIGTGIKGADLLFKEHIDFSSFVLKGEKETPYLINKDGVIIDETIYNLLVLYIRAMNNIPTPKVTRVKDDPMQKQMAIDDARNQIESKKRKAMFKPQGSVLFPIMSSLVNCAECKYDSKTIKDIGIFTFWDSVNRVLAIKNANYIYQGLYSGCVNLKENPSLKKEMDWMRRL